MPHAVLALAATLLLGAGPHQKPFRVLDPVSLEPVATSPAFPNSTDQIETSPDGTQFAAGFKRGLKVFDASGAEVTHVRVATYDRVLSWLTPDRIAIVKRGKPMTVRTVSVSQGKVIHREVLHQRLIDTARAGERQVTLTADKVDSVETLSVFDADGALVKSIPLPDVDDGELRSRPVAGQVLVMNGGYGYDGRGAKMFYDAIDTDTGAIVRHDLDLPEGTGQWVVPQTGDALAVGNYGGFFVIGAGDAVTHIRGIADVRGAGDGFLSFDKEGSVPLKVLDATGQTVWQVKADPLDAAAFGDRVYTGSGYHDVHIREYDLATGTLRTTLPGRAYLTEPSAGRVQPPFFTSGAINED